MTVTNRTKLFSLFYYSQIQLVFIGMALTAATSSVLLGRISWESVWIVGLSTLSVYTIDNLVDWKTDSIRYPELIKFFPAYRVFCYAVLPILFIGILKFTLASPSSLQVALLLVCVTSLTVVFRLPQAPFLSKFSKLSQLVINRLVISSTWAVILVFVPVWHTGSGNISPQVWMTFAYLWQLTFITAVLWRIEKTEMDFEESEKLKNTFLRILMLLCVTTIILSVVDIILGYFPFHNIVVLLAPIASFFTLVYWSYSRTSLRIIFTTLNIFQVGFSILSAIIHLQ